MLLLPKIRLPTGKNMEVQNEINNKNAIELQLNGKDRLFQ